MVKCYYYDRCPRYVVCVNGCAYRNFRLKASLLDSDSAVKQILLTLDERPGQSFIIEDLDEFHVLTRADEEQRVRRELEAEVRSLHDRVILPFS
jgi:TFIIH basal transcription factor complex TTD-A subunit